MIYVILSVFLGLCAWIFPAAGLYTSNLKSKSLYIPIISFALCLLSIYVQFLLLESYEEEWVLIIDAFDALNFVIPVFAVITVMLNALYIRTINKNNSQGKRGDLRTMIPITQGKIGEFYTVEKVKGKLADKLQLEELGIVPEARIKLYTMVGSHVVCMIDGERFSISRDMASNIFVIEE